MDKSKLVIVNETQLQTQTWAASLGCQIGQFPIKYLGLPLSAYPLHKRHYIPLIQRYHNRLPGWATNLISFPGEKNTVKFMSLRTYYLFPVSISFAPMGHK
jgi:hypothetical protein